MMMAIKSRNQRMFNLFIFRFYSRFIVYFCFFTFSSDVLDRHRFQDDEVHQVFLIDVELRGKRDNTMECLSTFQLEIFSILGHIFSARKKPIPYTRSGEGNDWGSSDED